MPNKDWTWPRGQGKMTWREMWECKNSENRDFSSERDECKRFWWQRKWSWRWAWRRRCCEK